MLGLLVMTATLAASPAATATATVAGTGTVALPAPETTTQAPALLTATLLFEPLLTDYGLPSHPRTTGLSGLGTIVHGTLRWSPVPGLSVVAGARVRVPMTQDFEEELDALPILAVEVARKVGPLDTILRAGSLEYRRGFHPAIYDETRAAYGRDLARAYDSGVVEAGKRRLSGDPRPPGEHGGELTLGLGPWRTTTFLDWQLLETTAHRERFSFGVVSTLRAGPLEVSGQLRLDHYGGEQFTQTDPLRRAGLDPTRQSIAYGLVARGRVFTLGPVALEAEGALLAARIAQVAGDEPSVVGAFELGARVRLFEDLRVGYLFFRGTQDGAPYLAELGDPTYAEGPVHRLRLGVETRLGPAHVETRVDVVFPLDLAVVQYVLATRIVLPLEWVLLRRPLF